MTVVGKVRQLLMVTMLCASSLPVDAEPQPGIRVVVLMGGRAPKMPLLQRKTGESACQLKNPWTTDDEVLVGANGGMRNVVVFVSRNAPPGTPKDVELGHTNCSYKPRVSAVSASGTLRVVNTDQTPHNVHMFKGLKTVVNQMQPAGSAVLSREFADHGGSFLRIRCDLHSWENAVVFIVPSNTFGITGENGDVMLTDLTPGIYTITAWHERYGAKSVEVTVGPEGRGDAKIIYDGNEPRP